MDGNDEWEKGGGGSLPLLAVGLKPSEPSLVFVTNSVRSVLAKA
jgi:hypothetical protein